VLRDRRRLFQHRARRAHFAQCHHRIAAREDGRAVGRDLQQQRRGLIQQIVLDRGGTGAARVGERLDPVDGGAQILFR
jgi:hypothetical protein